MDRRSWSTRLGSAVKEQADPVRDCEREALAEHGVPLFALVNGSMDLKAMVEAFLAALPRILTLCASPLGGVRVDRAPQPPSRATVAVDEGHEEAHEQQRAVELA
jgi:hypothetical protein